jgi:prepilin-type N-terminal cleavage/methylation domain-containing protein
MKRKIIFLVTLLRTFSFKNQKGFTLVETLVSIALFGIISIFVVGSYLTISALQRATTARQQVASEERFVLDMFGREITWAVAIPDCPVEGCSVMRFAMRPRSDTPMRTIEYVYDSTSQNVLKAETKSFGPCQAPPDVHDTKNPFDDDPFPPECYQKIFSDAVKITSLKFFVVNNVDDTSQVVVTVAMRGTVMVNGKLIPLSLSSTFTPRFTQNTEFLVNGGVIGSPVLVYGGIYPSCENTVDWYFDWMDVANTTEYYAFFCAGSSCDPDPSLWASYSVWGVILPELTPFPVPDDNRPIYNGWTGNGYSVPSGTELHLALRAHQSAGNVWSAYSNVISAINPVKNPVPCGGGGGGGGGEEEGGGTPPPPPPPQTGGGGGEQ